jgi:dihydroflavonol-4-reductase
VGKTLVTGWSGFVGSHVVRLLAERGDDLRLILRPRSRLENLAGLEYERVDADILDRPAIRRSMRGVERVFHCAGLQSTHPADEERLFNVNVGGTRVVLEEALRCGAERVVYTSSAGAIGPAPGPEQAADERQLFTAGRLGIPYVNSKHEAEVEALQIAARGLPLVVVNPCNVFGRGDVYCRGTSVVRRFLLGRIPVYSNGGLNVVSVGDVARGHLLADVHGLVGERYILGNRNYTLERLFADLQRLSGVEQPPLQLRPALARRLAQAVEAAAPGGRGPITSQEVKLATNWWFYKNAKAKRELGFTTSPHEDTIEATVDWYLERESDRLARSRRTQPVPYKLAATALGAIEGAGGFARRLWPLGAF